MSPINIILRKKSLLITLLIGIVINLTACSSITTVESLRFYSLTPLSVNYQGQALDKRLSLGIGPLEISSVLNRPQLIYRQSNNEVKISEFNQWAGSLREEIQKTLVDRIAEKSGSQRIIPYPWLRDLTPEYEVQIRIERLDGSLGEKVVLEAHWDLFNEQSKGLVSSHNSKFEVNLKDDNYLDYVLAQQGLLVELADEILQTVLNDQKNK